MTTIGFLGASGMFGTDARSLLDREGFAVAGGDLPEVDITERASLAAFLDANPCDLVLNAAAYTNVDGAECQRVEAFRVNAQGAKLVAEACRERKLPLLFISSDYVFPGTRVEGYKPCDGTGPAPNAYGESKLAGERAVIETLPLSQFLVVRTQWLYGRKGPNFVDTILKAGRVKERLKVVNDQWGVPTRTVDLALQISALLKLRARGFAHAVGGGGPITWFDFASEIARLAGLSCGVEPCGSDEFPRPARRPLKAWLVNTNVPSEAVKHWRDGLAEHMAQIGSGVEKET